MIKNKLHFKTCSYNFRSDRELNLSSEAKSLKQGSALNFARDCFSFSFESTSSSPLLSYSMVMDQDSRQTMKIMSQAESRTLPKDIGDGWGSGGDYIVRYESLPSINFEGLDSHTQAAYLCSHTVSEDDQLSYLFSV